MKYIALLRGINIGSKNRIKMADLRTIFESMGYENVKTYLQSGNVIFDADSDNETKIADRIEKKINKTFGFSVNIIIRTESELKDIVNNNPFIEENRTEIDKFHLRSLVEKYIFICQMDIPELN